VSTFLRPEPVDPAAAHAARAVHQAPSAAAAAERLVAGERLVVVDALQTGLDVLDALRAALGPPPSSADTHVRRDFEARYRPLARGLVAPVWGPAAPLPGLGKIGFLDELYPEWGELWLPLVDLQELHGQWERYAQGVPMAVLGHRLRPFSGVYAPKRTVHLELFATWLAGWQGPRDRAVDVGTGSGVLALMLAKAGFATVAATDCNPNAVESTRREVERLELQGRVRPLHVDLLGNPRQPVDLVVFNPPWTQGTVRHPLDRALLFDDDLFERFFDQVDEHLAPDGRAVLLFSDLLRLVQPDVPHPIEAELERGRLRLVQKLRRRVPRTPGGRRTRERVEVWELARA
jgi:SAM-dependent methyltransferase